MFPWIHDVNQLPWNYHKVLKEIEPYLVVGNVIVRGKHYQESRMTTLFTLSDCKFRYSGRVISGHLPEPEIMRMFETINSSEFRTQVANRHKHLADLPLFNSVFINWYRPPAFNDGNLDHLGIHSDYMGDHLSEVILSLTLCEDHGERLFRFYPRGLTSYIAQYELKHGDILWMLEGCQEQFSHGVVARKTNLAREAITGGRLNLTFRSLKLN